MAAPSKTDAIAMLRESLETLEKYQDTRDGGDGRPLPNSAMIQCQRIDALLRELGESE